jgi:phytoene dehydrogenase-like protein
MLGRDGRALEWWTDFDRTVESFARFSPRDAATLRRWRDDFRLIVQQILIPESQSPPLPPDERDRLLRQSTSGRLLLDTSRLSPLEFVERNFEHPAVRAGLLFFNGLREVDLRLAGFGHHIPALLASGNMAQMCAGGSRALADALVDAVRESGGEVRLNTAPRRIVVENGRAAGVETADGEFLRATRFVASGLNPQQTFLELLEPAAVPSAWIERARAFQYNLLAPLFALLDHWEQFHEIVSHHEQGSIPPTVMWGSCPTVFDPSQAPAGRHTAFLWEKLPYRLGGDPRNWDRERDRHGQAMLRTWSEFAPGIENTVLDWFTRSPLDTERTLPNMRFGDLLVGAFAGGQIGFHRPFPGAGHYRGHMPGLYLCGSCCHPGGNVTGLPGYNCAQVLLADLGIRPSWVPEPIAGRLRRLAASG